MEHTDPSRRLLAVVCLASAAMLLFELALTRLLSVTTWYHFAFAVISAALLGLGAGSTLVALRPSWFPSGRELQGIATACMGAAILSTLALWVCLGVPPSMVKRAVGVVTNGSYAVAALLPFAAVGIILALALRAGGKKVGVVYAADLVGAALGALLFIPATSSLGAPRAMLLGAVGFAVAGLISATSRRQRIVAATITATIAFGMVLASTTDITRVRWAKGPAKLGAGTESYWNAYSNVTVSPGSRSRPFGWGVSPKSPEVSPLPIQYSILIDRLALTVLTAHEAEDPNDFSAFEYLRYDVTSAAYALRPGARSFIMGVGGGRDVLAALSSGASHVTGVEINERILYLVRERHREVARIADREDVELHSDEARSFLARQPEARYDVIQASLVDTWAASASGAFALSENGLYTADAWSLFLDRLTDDGILTISRWDNGAGSELMRMVSIAFEALRRRGVTTPEAHIAVIGSTGVGNMLTKRTPFTADELDKLEAEAERRGFELLYLPGRTTLPRFEPVANGAASWQAHIAQSDVDMSAPSDDRPFFFYRERPSQWLNPVELLRPPQNAQETRVGHTEPRHVLLAILFAATFGALTMLVLPAAFLARRDGGAPPIAALFYMAAIGLGFMLVEVPLLTRLAIPLGHPVLSLACVLTGILIASGVGSLLSSKLTASSRQRIVFLVPLIMLAAALCVGPLAGALAGLDGPGRVIGAVVFVVLIGLPLGVPLPAGLARAGSSEGSGTPLLFGINGAFSVLGSVIAMIVQLNAGARATMVVGALTYAVAALLLKRLGTD